jgi:hypothetical protein
LRRQACLKIARHSGRVRNRVNERDRKDREALSACGGAAFVFQQLVECVGIQEFERHHYDISRHGARRCGSRRYFSCRHCVPGKPRNHGLLKLFIVSLPSRSTVGIAQTGQLLHPTFSATWESAYSSRWRASLLNLRMPSASFSVAMASSLCIQRKSFSVRCRRFSFVA